ncbi:MAG: SRPBCC family protein [Thermoleophilia bacterium]|nr:SRPBCC family protein [Thermoleophilia bacterium]
MPSWAIVVDIDAPPDEVWAFIGDPTTVPRWYPKYVSCEVEGDARTLRSAEGAVLHELLLERNDDARFYSYSVVSGAPVRTHLASFEVTAEGTGSRIRWATTAEPIDPAMDMQARLSPTQTEAMQRVKRILEGGEA